MRPGDVTLLLQVRHVVSHGGWADAQGVLPGKGLGGDRVGRLDVVANQSLEQLCFSVSYHLGSTWVHSIRPSRRLSLKFIIRGMGCQAILTLFDASVKL